MIIKLKNIEIITIIKDIYLETNQSTVGMLDSDQLYVYIYLFVLAAAPTGEL